MPPHRCRVPPSFHASIRRRAAAAASLLLASAALAAGSVALLPWAAERVSLGELPWGERLLVHLGALLLPVALLPALHAAALLARARRDRRLAAASDGIEVELADDALRVGALVVPWGEVLAVELHARSIALHFAPAPGRPASLLMLDAFADLPAGALVDLVRARLQPGDEATRAADRRVVDEACAGRALPPGCFVVRLRKSGAVGLVLTPWSLLVRGGSDLGGGEDDGVFRRVPWRHVARVELGSADPREPVTSDLLVARDAAGRPLASVATGPLGIAAPALLEIAQAIRARAG